MYYSDSKQENLCNGIIGVRDTIWRIKNSEMESYILNDSLVYLFQEGELERITKYDLIDSIYDVHKRHYFPDRVNYIKTITRSSYLNGKKNGPSYSFNSDKPFNIITLSSFFRGKLNGYSVTFKNDGYPLKECMYKNGEINGFERNYYKDINQIRYEAQYIEGIPNGSLRTWWKNGNVQSESNYKNNRIVGESKIYLENGDLACIQYFNDDKLLKTEIYIKELPEIIKDEFLSFPDYLESEVILKYKKNR